MIKFCSSRLLLLTVWLILFGSSVYSQSTAQNYPTPVTTNEVNGEIKARDIGDARLTTYFYTFNATQGDMFVNVVAKNFNGSFDIFAAENLQPLTKILVYADSSDSETGRVIYLRKPEKLILRVEGRSPNDDSAIYTLKFAGGFVAAEDTGVEAPELPEIKASETRTRVNSVGTVLERIPKKKPTPTPAVVATSAEPTKEKPGEEIAKTEEKSSDHSASKKEEPKTDTTAPETGENKPEVVVSDSLAKANTEAASVKTPADRSKKGKAPAKKETVKTVAANDSQTNGSSETKEPVETKSTNDGVSTEKKSASVSDNSVPTLIPPRRKKPAPVEKPAEPNPLENIHLVIELKDGTRIEKPMSEVVRFTVDKGILTVVSKDGTISRFQILDVLKTTIQ